MITYGYQINIYQILKYTLITPLRSSSRFARLSLVLGKPLPRCFASAPSHSRGDAPLDPGWEFQNFSAFCFFRCLPYAPPTPAKIRIFSHDAFLREMQNARPIYGPHTTTSTCALQILHFAFSVGKHHEKKCVFLRVLRVPMESIMRKIAEKF